MVQSLLIGALIVLTFSTYSLAQGGAPRPNTDVPTQGTAPRINLPRGAVGDDDSWMKRRSAESGDSSAWYRVRVTIDLKALQHTGREVMQQTELQNPDAQRALTRSASKVAKLSRNLWANIQYGKANRPKPKSKLDRTEEQTIDRETGINELRRLIVEVLYAVNAENHKRTVDASSRNDVLDKLEALNRLALQVVKEFEK
jgi:hypothetical protein